MTYLREPFRYNSESSIFIEGDHYTDGSVQLLNKAGEVILKHRIDGIWQPGSLRTSPASIWLGENVGLSAIGHYLASSCAPVGMNHLYAHTIFDGETTIADTRVPYVYDFVVRTIVQGDNSGVWSGTSFDYIVTSTQTFIVQSAYLQTDTIAASQPVRWEIFQGTDDTGKLIFDQEFPASEFPASTEINLTTEGYLQFEESLQYYHRLTSDATFSLKTDVTQTYAWLASDRSLYREENLLQTAPWQSGRSWVVGEYFIDNRQIYVCNSNFTPLGGTFQDFLDKFDLLGTHDGVNYWTKGNDNLTYNDGHVIVGGGNIMASGSGSSNNGFIAGLDAGLSLTNGFGNVLIGYEAGQVLTTEDENTFVGWKAGLSASGLDNAVAIGSYALENADGAFRTVAVGREAGKNANGVDCVYLGMGAGEDNDTHDKLFIGNTLGTLIEGDFANSWVKVHGDLRLPSAHGDKVSLYGDLIDDVTMLGLGTENGTLYYKASNFHRWYINQNADLGASARMALTVAGLEIFNGILEIGSGYPIIWGDASTSINGSSVTDAEYLKLQTAGVVRMTIDGDGLVAIGRTPDTVLNTAFEVGSTAYSTNIIVASSSLNKDIFWVRESADSDGSIHMFDKTERQTILFTTDENISYIEYGNFGVGTNNPAYKLVVKTGVANDGIRLLNALDALRLRFAINNLDDGYLGITDRNGAETILLATEPNTDSYINTGGNFGINNPNPSFPLDVNGNGNFAGAVWVQDFEVYNYTEFIGVGVTTGEVVKILGADLTTGSSLLVYNNSVDTSVRSLVKIHNDNPLAIRATPLSIQQDANIYALHVDATGVTNNDAMVLTLNSLTTGNGLVVYSNAASTSERALVHIHNANIAAQDAIPLRITQDSNAANPTSIHIDSGDIKLFNDSDLAIDIGNIIMTAGGSIYLADNGKVQVQGGDVEIFDGGNLTMDGGGDFSLSIGSDQRWVDGLSRFTVPRMTTTQRDAMSDLNGTIIYNTSLNRFEFYENNNWVTK